MKKLNAKSFFKSDYFTYLLVILSYLIVQTFVWTDNISSLLQGLLVPLCVYVILAISLNLTVGVLGDLSLGHAGFMCVGAFVGSIFSVVTQSTIENDMLRLIVALVLGAVVAGIVGLLIGIPVLRLSGDYLAIVTLAFGEIIKNIVNVLYLGVDANGWHVSFESTMDLGLLEDGKVIVKGAQGITGTPSVDKDIRFTIGIILVLISLFIVFNFTKSRTGRAVMAIRDNRIAAESVGINITKYKLLAFTISASLAGLAGVLYSHNIAVLKATTANFGYTMSILILVFVVLGGIGNMRGSMIAAVVLTLLPELFRGLADYRMLIYALALIIMMLFTSAPGMVAFREKYFTKEAFSSIFKKNKNKEVA